MAGNKVDISIIGAGASGIVHRNETRSHRIFALGEITRGVHFYTNAISQNARCADRITDSIVKSICGSKMG